MRTEVRKRMRQARLVVFGRVCVSLLQCVSTVLFCCRSLGVSHIVQDARDALAAAQARADSAVAYAAAEAAGAIGPGDDAAEELSEDEEAASSSMTGSTLGVPGSSINLTGIAAGAATAHAQLRLSWERGTRVTSVLLAPGPEAPGGSSGSTAHGPGVAQPTLWVGLSRRVEFYVGCSPANKAEVPLASKVPMNARRGTCCCALSAGGGGASASCLLLFSISLGPCYNCYNCCRPRL